MGVAGLWDILRPAGQTRSLTHLAVVDGFEANPDGARGLRVGIDASIWFYHAAYGREGENPELRTLFFKCTRLMSAPFLPLFVFDGPKRPEVKRGKRISGKNHWMIQGMQEIINAFGFEWRMAPGEAEAELAFLNRIGVIDAVYTDDVDTFLFGAKMIIRNASATLSGNRAHSLKNSDGREDGNHVATYTSDAILAHPSVQLTQGGLILIGILRGGDYHQAGLAGCGGTIAHALARCGFGDSLLTAARTLPRAELPAFLRGWREELRAELRTNARGVLGKKYAALAKKVPEDFPDIDVLLSYTHPVTSESEAAAKGKVSKNTKIDWEKEPNLGKIAALCEMYFEWGVKEIIIKRFRTVLWPAAVLRILRRIALLEDKRAARATVVAEPRTPTKKGKEHARRVPGTPSSVITKHFSSLQLASPSRKQGTSADSENDSDEDGEDKLIVKIHSARQHASTDGVLEYRLEIAPAHLVRLAESGVRGLRTALATGLDDDSDAAGDDDDSDGGGKGKKRAPKPPPDPQSHLRIWLPACMVRIAQPDLVEEFEGVREKRAAKKAGKASTVVRGTKTKAPTAAAAAKPKATKTDPSAIREEEEESSEDEGYVSPTPKKARTKTARLEPSVATKTANMKNHFAVGKHTQPTKEPQSSTAKISALFADMDEPLLPKRALSKAPASALHVNATSDEESSIRTCSGASSSRLPSLTSSSRASSSLGRSHSEASSSEVPVPPKHTFVPAPFPMSFDDDTSAMHHPNERNDLQSRFKRPPNREKSPVRIAMHGRANNHDGHLQKLPRKSQKQTLPRKPNTTRPRSPVIISSSEGEEFSDRPITPSPARRHISEATSKLLPASKTTSKVSPTTSCRDRLHDISIISISSGSESETVVSKPKIAPLLLARTKASTAPRLAKPSSEQSRATARPPTDPVDIIDLT